jgi:hypothetical protein
VLFARLIAQPVLNNATYREVGAITGPGDGGPSAGASLRVMLTNGRWYRRTEISRRSSGRVLKVANRLSELLHKSLRGLKHGSRAHTTLS